MDKVIQNNRKNRSVADSDEIELIDILVVLWKWKFFIIITSFIATLIGGAVFYYEWKNQPEIYRVETKVVPPSKGVDEENGKKYVYSLKSIKDEIKYNIMKHQGEINVSIPESGDCINVAIDALSKKEAEKMQKFLQINLKKRYDPLINKIRNQIIVNIEMEKKKIINFEKIKAYKIHEIEEEAKKIVKKLDELKLLKIIENNNFMDLISDRKQKLVGFEVERQKTLNEIELDIETHRINLKKHAENVNRYEDKISILDKRITKLIFDLESCKKKTDSLKKQLISTEKNGSIEDALLNIASNLNVQQNIFSEILLSIQISNLEYRKETYENELMNLNREIQIEEGNSIRLLEIQNSPVKRQVYKPDLHKIECLISELKNEIKRLNKVKNNSKLMAVYSPKMIEINNTIEAEESRFNKYMEAKNSPDKLIIMWPEIGKISDEIGAIKLKVKNLEAEKRFLRNIEIANSNEVVQVKTKNRWKRNLLLMLFASFSISIFFSFFMEYIQKVRKRNKIVDLMDSSVLISSF